METDVQENEEDESVASGYLDFLTSIKNNMVDSFSRSQSVISNREETENHSSTPSSRAFLDISFQSNENQQENSGESIWSGNLLPSPETTLETGISEKPIYYPVIAETKNFSYSKTIKVSITDTRSGLSESFEFPKLRTFTSRNKIEGIIICRMDKLKNKEATEIMLQGDIGVSRLHTRLSFKHLLGTGFRISRKKILALAHLKGKGMPIASLFKIIKYLLPPPTARVQDLKSTRGTFIRISSNKPFFLKEEITISLGLDLRLQVTSIHDPLNPAEDFIQNCAKVKNYKTELQINFEELSSRRIIFFKTIGFPSSWPGDIAVLEEATFGRDPNCDVSLNLGDLSRIQARLKYEPGGWALYDGEDNKPSKNGTWVSVEANTNFSIKQPIKAVEQILVSSFLISFSIIS